MDRREWTYHNEELQYCSDAIRDNGFLSWRNCWIRKGDPTGPNQLQLKREMNQRERLTRPQEKMDFVTNDRGFFPTLPRIPNRLAQAWNWFPEIPYVTLCNLSISPMNMFAFLTALVLADIYDLVTTLQVTQRWNQSALGPDGLEQCALYGDLLLEDAHKTPIELRPRQSSAKLIDTFPFGNAYEVAKKAWDIHGLLPEHGSWKVRPCS